MSDGTQPSPRPFDTRPREGESYMDGEFFVFTEAYHLRRGFCCRSGCRHCPYGFVSGPAQQPAEERE